MNDLYPHAPSSVSLRYMDTVTVVFVVFTILIMVGLPLMSVPSVLVSHGSPDALAAGADVDVNVTSSVGSGNGVFVDRGVCVGASVGGKGVAVGIAAWVWATIVNAAAMAVFWTSTGLTVGTGSAPHALMIIVMATIMVSVGKRFMFYEYLLMGLAIRKAAASGFDAVIGYNNFPTTFCDSEAAERLKILFTGDKCCGTVLPDRTGEAVTRDDQIPALVQRCHHIHGQNDGSLWFSLVCDGEIRSGSLPRGQGLITDILVVCRI